MVNAICKEIALRQNYLQDKNLQSIYFGGGTPSLLNQKQLLQIFETIEKHFTIHPNAEITLEANPDDLSEEKLSELKHTPINRLSIGVQSFFDADLKWMNRAHNSEEALNCVGLAKKAGFENISVDLIYGLPNFSIEDWKKNIQTVIRFGIQHVSAYCLTVEEKTVLSKWVAQKKIVPANEDDQSEQFEILVNELEKAGIEQYEISNFSLPGFHSKHNSNYWKGKHYLGIGPSAHSFNGTSRSWNIANNRTYMREIQEGKRWFETEELTTKNQFNEFKNEMRNILESVSLLASIQSQVIINKTNSACIETSVSKDVKAFKEQIESKPPERMPDDQRKASKDQVIMDDKIKQDLPNNFNQYKDQISSQLHVIQGMICDSNRYKSRKTTSNSVCFYCAKPNHNYDDCRSASADEKNAVTNSLNEKKFDFNNLRERAASFSNKRRNQHSIENQNNSSSQNTVASKKAKN